MRDGVRHGEGGGSRGRGRPAPPAVAERADLRRIAATLEPSRSGAEERDDFDAYGGALASEMVGGAL